MSENWKDQFNPREQEEIKQCRLHYPHLYDANTVSFLYDIPSGVAMGIIAKMANLLDEVKATLLTDGKEVNQFPDDKEND